MSKFIPTPRTDTEVKKDNRFILVVSAEFARKIEREVITLKKIIDTLEQVVKESSEQNKT